MSESFAWLQEPVWLSDRSSKVVVPRGLLALDRIALSVRVSSPGQAFDV
jgi:hypothetical protein